MKNGTAESGEACRYGSVAWRIIDSGARRGFRREECSALQDRFHRVQQIAGCFTFGNRSSNCAGLKAANQVFGEMERKHYDRDIGAALGYPGRSLEAIHLRHRHVHYNAVVRELETDFPALSSGTCHD